MQLEDLQCQDVVEFRNSAYKAVVCGDSLYFQRTESGLFLKNYKSDLTLEDNSDSMWQIDKVYRPMFNPQNFKNNFNKGTLELIWSRNSD